MLSLFMFWVWWSWSYFLVTLWARYPKLVWMNLQELFLEKFVSFTTTFWWIYKAILCLTISFLEGVACFGGVPPAIWENIVLSWESLSTIFDKSLALKLVFILTLQKLVLSFENESLVEGMRCWRRKSHVFGGFFGVSLWIYVKPMSRAYGSWYQLLERSRD